ncbi:hypothetical protein ACSSS7_005266 [Eimeria intestinalis]
MDLDEIIKPYSLAPEGPKRPGPEGAQGPPGNAKRFQTGAGVGGAAELNGAEGPQGKVSLDDLPDELDPSTVEKILEQADEVHIEEITEASIRRCAAQLERRVKKNQHDRIKFASNPEKWIKSEVDLDEEVKRWTQVAASPSLFPLLFESGAFDILTSLLSHANTDLAIDAVEVFSELTEADSVMDAPDPQAVVDQLIFKKSQDRFSGTHRRNREPCVSYLKRDDLIAAAAGVSAFVADGARLHAAEVLAALLQQLQPQEKSQLGGRTGADGVDRLLRAVAPYRKKDPESAQEVKAHAKTSPACPSTNLQEPVKVAANSNKLCSWAKLIFLDMLHDSVMFFTPQAVKALDFALMDLPANCTTFVERLGLRSLFSLFLGKVKDGGYKPKKPEDLIEHVVSIINSLLKNCTGTPIARVLNKFQECGFEKVERLLELRETYASRVRKITDRTQVTEEMQEIDKEMGVDPEERRYLDACEAGLSILQQLDCIIMRLTNAGNAMVRMRLMDLMRMKNIDYHSIETVVKEFADHVDEAAEAQKRDLLTLSKYFNEAWNEQEEEEEDLEEE